MNNSWVCSFYYEIRGNIRNFDLCTLYRIRRTSVSTHYFYLAKREMKISDPIFLIEMDLAKRRIFLQLK